MQVRRTDTFEAIIILFSPKNKEDPCMYIHETEGCEPDGKINYLDLYYCKLYKRPWAAYIVLVSIVMNNEWML